MNRARLIVFSAVAVAVFFLVVLIRAGEYPVARVNGSFITARAFARQYTAGKTYASAFLTSVGQVSSSSVRGDVPENDMRAVVLDELVEQSLVHQRLGELLGSGYNALVDGKIAKYESDASLKNAAGKLFGLSYADFRSLVLVPAAEKELLTARIFLEGETYDGWVRAARSSASVAVYSSSFSWDGNRVVAK